MAQIIDRCADRLQAAEAPLKGQTAIQERTHKAGHTAGMRQAIWSIMK